MSKKLLCFFLLCLLLNSSNVWANTDSSLLVANTRYEWETIIEAKLDSVKRVGDFYRIQQGKQYGLIDLQGRTVFEPRFEKIFVVNAKSALGQRKKSASTNEFVGMNGRVVFTLPSDVLVADFYNGEAIVSAYGTIKLGDNGKMIVKPQRAGVIDAKGKFTIPMIYDYLQRVVDVRSGVVYAANKGLGASAVYGIVSRTGKIIVPFQYSSLRFNALRDAPNLKLTLNGGLIIAGKNKKYGVITLGGQTIVPLAYDDIRADKYFGNESAGSGYFDNGQAVVKKTGKYGVIDQKGKVIIPFQYSDIANVKEVVWNEDIRIGSVETDIGVYKVRSGKQYGLINNRGQNLGKFEWDEIGSFSGGMAPVVKNRKVGFVDRRGKLVIPLKYDLPSDKSVIDGLTFEKGIFIVARNGKYGFASDAGREISEPQWDQVEPFHNGISKVKKNGKYGYLDKTGKLISEPQWDSATVFDNGYAVITKGKLSGVINAQGEIVLSIDMIREELSKNGINPDQKMSLSVFDQAGFAVLRMGEGTNTTSYYIDRSGHLAFANGYALIGEYENGLSRVYDGPVTDEKLVDWDAPDGSFHIIDVKGNIVLTYPKELEAGTILDSEPLTWDQHQKFPENYIGFIDVKGKIGVITLRNKAS
ncbi:WG repeat-containing protein [Cohnella suwonensis]|uniref:WG repeat-containing protein n=1 Tax=Cohnella suwonensis TaxID=696072 RepID=A0ABW0LSB3_9BACL